MTSITAATGSVIETADLMAEFKECFEFVMHSDDTLADETQHNLKRARQIQAILEGRGFTFEVDGDFNVIGFSLKF